MGSEFIYFRDQRKAGLGMSDSGGLPPEVRQRHLLQLQPRQHRQKETSPNVPRTNLPVMDVSVSSSPCACSCSANSF
jgi:hypothetical protein